MSREDHGRSTESGVRVEVCVDQVDGAVIAENAGADRIEVCADLTEGGLTPSIGMLTEILHRVRHIGVQVLIRPRPGDFVYQESEIRVMEADIAAVRTLDHAPGVTMGFVVGALRPDREIDLPVTRRLMAACGPGPVTFHRAFDLVSDPMASLETLAGLGVSRVLTAGAAPSALEGGPTLSALAAAGRVGVLAAGGVRAHNVAEIVARTGVPEVHFSAQRIVAAPGPQHGPALPPAGEPIPGDRRPVPDETAVRDVLRALAGPSTPVTGGTA